MSKRNTVIFAVSCSFLVGSGAVFAADMAVKASPPSVPPAPAPVYYGWTGWYIGGNVGGSFGAADTNIAGSATTLKIPSDNFPNTFNFANSSAQRLQGAIGGGQIGYNYQISPRWVLGFETDIQASGERASNTFATPFSGPICVDTVTTGANGLCTSPLAEFKTLNGVAVTSEEAKIGWFGTVRGRVGYLLNDGLLLYGTGGLAYGQTSVSGNVTVSASQPGSTAVGITNPSTFGPTTSFFGQSKTNIGFAAGAGLEGRFSSWLPPNWTWKVEYLFVDPGIA